MKDRSPSGFPVPSTSSAARRLMCGWVASSPWSASPRTLQPTEIPSRLFSRRSSAATHPGWSARPTGPSTRRQQLITGCQWLEHRSPDVSTAVWLLGRRPLPRDAPGLYLSRVDLRAAHLPNAQLPSVGLRHANLARAVLLGVNLERSDLEDADLRHSDLRAARLTSARLPRVAGQVVAQAGGHGLGVGGGGALDAAGSATAGARPG